MATRILLVAVLAAIFVIPFALAADEAKAPLDLENATCPVKGTPAKATITETYKGMKVHFCCVNCAAKFKASPDQYVSALREDPAVAKKMDTALAAAGSTPSIDAAVAGWPEASRAAATKTAERHGAPKETGADRLTWGEVGPWARIVVHKDGVALEQVVAWKVEGPKAADVGGFDHVKVDASRGEVSARHDREELNVLALNLAHEVASGKKTIEQGNAAFAEGEKALKAGKGAPLTDRLTFPTTKKDEASSPR